MRHLEIIGRKSQEVAHCRRVGVGRVVLRNTLYILRRGCSHVTLSVSWVVLRPPMIWPKKYRSSLKCVITYN